MKPLMTVKDLSGTLKVKERFIYKLIRNKDVPYVRIGREYRFNTVSISNWLAQKEDEYK